MPIKPLNQLPVCQCVAHGPYGSACLQALPDDMVVSMRFARFSMFTSMDRNLAITNVCDAVSEANGWVADQSFFSNIAATINFEMPSRSLGKLQESLRDKGLNPHVEGELPAADGREVRGSVSLTFSHNEPDMRREVPPFG